MGMAAGVEAPHLCPQSLSCHKTVCKMAKWKTGNSYYLVPFSSPVQGKSLPEGKYEEVRKVNFSHQR